MDNRQFIWIMLMWGSVCSVFALQPGLVSQSKARIAQPTIIAPAQMGQWDEQPKSFHIFFPEELIFSGSARGENEEHIEQSLSQAAVNLFKTFTHIDCGGEVSILLDPEGPEGQIRPLTSDIKYSSTDKVLYLYGTPSEQQQPYNVIISGRRLVSQIQSVDLHDKCALKGLGLRQPSWHLRSSSTGNVILRGVFERCIIEQYADSIIDLYWVGGRDIDVFSQRGVMRLAGTVEHARFRAIGESQLYFQQLRAKTAWLQASGHTFVSLSGSGRLTVFTEEYAQVVSEGIPKLENFLSKSHAMFVVDDY